MRRRAAAFTVVATFLLLPAVAQAIGPAPAQAIGPASFLRASGAPLVTPLGLGGLTTYSASPAYLTLPVNGTTLTIERYASSRSFSAVAVRDTRAGRTGEACFADVHVVVAPLLISDFTVRGRRFHGLLMQYAKTFFLAGHSRAADCARSAGPAIPTVTFSRNSATLTVDCLARTCRGSFASFAPPSSCANPITLLPGRRGCLPENTGSFTLIGGLFGRFQLQLFGRSPRSTLFGMDVNGTQRAIGPLSSLPRTQRQPQRPRKTTLSLTCTSASLGGSVTAGGSLAPSGPRVPVTLTFAGPAGGSSTVTATTAPGGRFSTPFTPGLAGTWTVVATFAGDRSRRPASGRCSFRVT